MVNSSVLQVIKGLTCTSVHASNIKIDPATTTERCCMPSLELLIMLTLIQSESIYDYTWVIFLIILFFKNCFVPVNLPAIDKTNLRALTF